jgi:hypothetical protein
MILSVKLDFCVSHNYTQRDLLLPPSSSSSSALLPSVPDNEYKWIMHYQDHFTKFSVLRPLKSKRAAEVAYNLLDTFLFLGPLTFFRVTMGGRLLPTL